MRPGGFETLEKDQPESWKVKDLEADRAGSTFFVQSCEILTKRRESHGGLECFSWFLLLFFFYGMTSMMHICAGLAGPKSREKGTCGHNTYVCDVFKVSLEAHETKEKGNKRTKERTAPFLTWQGGGANAL